MIQHEMLEYQSLDLELNKIERELKNNEIYLKRREKKAALQKAEEQLNRFEQKAVELRNKLASAAQNIKKINEIIEYYSAEINDLEDTDELNYLSKKLESQLALLATAESELKQILKDGEDIDKNFEIISKTQLPKIAAEYKKYTAEFDKITNSLKPRVLELKKRQAELKKAIDPNLLEIYSKISEQKRPAFVPLQDKIRCGGCRMTMPEAQVNSKISQEGYMICEHCGRLIYKN